MPSSGDLPDPGIKPVSPAPAALAGRFFITNSTWEARVICYHLYILKRKYIYIYKHLSVYITNYLSKKIKKLVTYIAS